MLICSPVSVYTFFHKQAKIILPDPDQTDLEKSEETDDRIGFFLYKMISGKEYFSKAA